VEKETVKKKATKKTAKKPAEKTAKVSSSGGKNLLVVESPAKAKTIKKFLGRDFTVKASMGHVRDIPSKGRGKKAFGIDFENRYEPAYEPIKGREKVLKELADAAEKADTVYLAPDPDREGEAIAWHIREALHLPAEKTRRVTFNSITKAAVRAAVENPGEINMNLVNAQQGRRVLDRIVGFSLSPFLWKKVTKGLSAGRVQSVAVRIVVEREKEIRAFTPEEFWRIIATLFKNEGKKNKFQAALVEWKGQKFELGKEAASTGESANAIAELLRAAEFKIVDMTERQVKGRPSPAFITSTLQQAASTFLRFGTSKTMRIAQQLYEGVEIQGEATGLITYMRTDSTRIAPEALTEARYYIENNFAPEYLPEKAQVYSSRKGAQDAHEAIRPTSVLLTPDKIKEALTPDQFKLYDLIWKRFVGSQMMPAVYQTTTARIAAAEGILEAKGRQVIFDGYTVLGLGQSKKKKKVSETGDEEEGEDEDQLLPPLAVGDVLNLDELNATQHFTQPPPRYSEASLVRALEKEGIGRPSTYAPIVQTIQDRGYVRLEQRRFHATELGIAVTDMLIVNFPGIMELKFTAGMESDLDSVEEGEADWAELVDKFYKPFAEKLESAMENAESLKGKPAPNGEKCPVCGEAMLMRYSQRGAFLGCEKYPDCKGTTPLPGEDDSELGEDDEQIDCPACGSPMARKRSRFGVFLACPNYPECKQTMPIGKDGKAVRLPEVKLDCEKCGKPMVVKSSRRGPFLACSGYPDCKNAKPISKDGNVIELPKVEGEVCDKCGAEMIVRMGRRGPFLACSAYPKCRNAKPIPKTEKEGEENPVDAVEEKAED
jgi:DNA topoisomerase-1